MKDPSAPEVKPIEQPAVTNPDPSITEANIVTSITFNTLFIVTPNVDTHGQARGTL